MIESGQLRHGVPELMGRPNFWPGGQMIDPAQMALYGQESEQDYSYYPSYAENVSDYGEINPYSPDDYRYQDFAEQFGLY